MNEPIYVTRPSLPPLADFVPMLEEIWRTRVLTNSGPFHQRLEARLGEHLQAPHLALTANGMLALEVAIQAAGLEGEVITTPYSFVATSHAAELGQLTPVFADIAPDGFNIDPVAIEAAITPRTSAIVAVHCYGYPCEVHAIKTIADRHGLIVIYDAAHAFGVRLNGESVFVHGDYSALSFHATKAFNTFEGGAVICATAAARDDVNRRKNFGIASEVDIPLVGSNAKMSELNAALGLLQLDRFGEVLRERGRVDARYRRALNGIEGLQVPPVPAGVDSNYSYMPILVTDAFPLDRDALYDRLKAEGIYSRRYFYPLLSNLDMYRSHPSANPANLPRANRVVEQVLCLPIYPDLTDGQIDRITDAIAAAAKG